MAFESSIMSARTKAPSDDDPSLQLPLGQEGFGIHGEFPEPLSARSMTARLLTGREPWCPLEVWPAPPNGHRERVLLLDGIQRARLFLCRRQT